MKRKIFRFAIMTSIYSIAIFAIMGLSSSLLSAKDGYGQAPDPQKVFLSLNIENKPLGGVFKEIENKTQFSFFYNANNLNINQQISLKADKKSVAWVLSQISTETGLEFKQINNYFCIIVY